MNKYLKKLVYLTPVAIIGGSVGLYFALSNKQESENNKPRPDRLVAGYQSNNHGLEIKVFPDIQKAEFYKYIRIEDGLPYIPNEMIARIVNKVLEKMQFTDGEVQWGYKFVDELKKDDLLLSFKFTPNTLSLNIKPSERIYHIKIT